MSTAPIGLMDKGFLGNGWPRNRKKSKHMHRHTDIFKSLKERKSRFKEGDKVYYIHFNTASIGEGTVQNVDWSAQENAYYVTAINPHCSFLDKKDTWTLYPYKEKINALLALRKYLYKKCKEIENEMDKIEQQEEE